MNEVEILPISTDRVRSIAGVNGFDKLYTMVESTRALLDKRIIWNINSTAQGGGVAAMLQPLIAYARGLGADVRWLVIDGDPGFFAATKRIHNNLHGHHGDGGALGDAERKCYELVLDGNLNHVEAYVRPGDIVICHDPQTAGLIPGLRRRGAFVIWRCHIGHDRPNELAERAWDFLAPYVEPAHHYVFTRPHYVPRRLEMAKSVFIPPSIDPLSPKNQPMALDVARSILIKTGILAGLALETDPIFRRENGKVAQVERCADVIHLGRAPSPDRRLVVQVSRWDRLKDPIGVLHGFAQYIGDDSASLVLAGPNVSAVADDPEGGKVLDEVFVAWRELPHEVRKHIHLVCLPMADVEENAAIVNALQRHATIVVQKSLYEGFGLTVTEAMWKSRPVIATGVGGIRDQIESGVHGLLVDDPNDLPGFARSVARLLAEPDLAQQLGGQARKRVEDQYLFTRHLFQYFQLFKQLLA